MKLSAVVLSLSMLFLLAAAPAPAPAPAPNAPAKPRPASDWVYQGCFSLTGSSPCYDVYTHNGTYWMCSDCGTTSQPTEKSCRQLSSWEVYHGYWCS